MSLEPSKRFVSRGGDKLAAALDHFLLDVRGLTCADLGSHVGGFADCLLGRGAAKVYAIDTSYGTLAWKLRKDDRVVVLERQNAMHVALLKPLDLVTIDVGWTRQVKVLPNVRTMLKDGGRVVTLIKPHYEADKSLLENGVLPPKYVEPTVVSVLETIRALGWTADGTFPSPLPGRGGNREVFALLRQIVARAWGGTG